MAEGGAAAAEEDSSAPGAPDAPAQDAYAPPAISLPRGGGAIRGIGEKLTTNPMTGTASMTVPIATSAGRSGFGPQLSVVYDSGRGNGPFGFGWGLDLPSIARKTERGLPRYAEDSDDYVLSGAEDLVPALVEDAPGHWVGDQHERAGFQVRRYRPRVEGLFARIERWSRLADGDTHWRSITRENVLTVYGIDAESRIADPADPSRVFSWLACQSYDDRGNAIAYGYVAEDDAGIDRTRAGERNRVRTAGRYLKRIRYGNRVPLLVDPAAPSFRAPHVPAPDLAGAGWMFEVVLDYGEGHYRPQPPDADGRTFVDASVAAPPGSAWPVRADAFSSYRAGFEVRSHRLCRRILTFHHFPAELGTDDHLVRATAFGYDQKPFGSFLSSVTQSGYRRGAAGRYLERSIPTVELDYARSPLEDPAHDGFEVREVDPAGLANLPTGIDSERSQWVDLDGEGLAGVLVDAAGAWLYKPNLGEARFGPAERVAAVPAMAGGPTRHQLVDVTGDGTADLVDITPGTAGFHARTGDGDGDGGRSRGRPGERAGWDRLRSFRTWPNVDLGAPNVRLTDVTGDGRPDVLVTDDESISWYESLAEDGFAAGVRIPLPGNEERAPRLVAADQRQSVHLADLSGDGLSDIVRIRNGDVSYWPNLGYGRFGAKVTMDGAPRLDRPEQFDQRRVRLADVDGSGTADLIYLGDDGVRIHLNEAGNGWSAPRRLANVPAVDGATSVTVVDLLGRGTACIQWSSRLPARARRPMRYVDLVEGAKPHLLVGVRNNLGVETAVEYAASTEFYLADKAAGRPWATRLPFPVHVVRRVTTTDRVSRNRFVTSYAYHHGHFDGIEREFRGFGMVEQLDSEQIGALTAAGELPAADAAAQTPPALTKTWFHTGAYAGGERISRHMAGEYQREPGLTDGQLAAMLLDDTTLPAGLAPDEAREACRALKGSLLRTEVYGLDGSPHAERPYTVSERNYTIRPLQPRGGNRHAVFLAHPREQLDLRYERRLHPTPGGERADPRVVHSLTLEVDDYGNVLRSAEVAYRRRRDDPDARLTEADRELQRRTFVTATAVAVTNAVVADDAYRAPVACDTSTFEVVNVAPAASEAGVTNLFRFAELDGLIAQAGDGAHDLEPDDHTAAGTAGPAPFRRLTRRQCTLYRSNDMASALPLGGLEALALPLDSRRLAFTAGMAARTFVDSGKLTAAQVDAALGGEGGYVHSGGDTSWWAPSTHVFYSASAADTPAQELAAAVAHFFVPRRYRDPFGNDTTIVYDGHDLLRVESRDAVGNRVTAGVRDQFGNVVANGCDYRTLQPAVVMDANRNRSAAAFDALGLVVATALMGKPEEQLGDSLDGLDPDPADAAVAAHMADPLAAPAALVGRATSRLVHDFFAYARTAAQPHPSPAAVCTLTRETHDSDLGAGQTTRVQQRFTYSDGVGREIQAKAPAEPGPVVAGGPDVPHRWVASGWTVYDGKGKPVRRYEPFFDADHAFRFGNLVGVSPIVLYDPVGRAAVTVHPDHTWERVDFDPWRSDSWDRSDTALVPDPGALPELGDRLGRLPDAEYLPTWHETRAGGALGPEAQDAARATAIHAGTPSIDVLDALGRTVANVAHNRFKRGDSPPADPPVEELHRTRTTLDAEGNQRTVTDARERLIVRIDYDLLGRRVHVASMEAGERWALADPAGRPVRGWDSRGHAVTTEYDAIRRPVRMLVRGSDPAESDPGTLARDLVFETVDYGEGQPDDVARNLRSHEFRRRDGAGVDVSDLYDFKGNVLHTGRQLVQDYKARPDWSGAPALEATTYATHATFDALNRPRALTGPDGSVMRPAYNDGNLLERIEVNVRGAAAATTFVAGFDYDAKRRRTRIAYGNGATTRLEFDPLTFRLARAVTTRPAGANGLAAQLFGDVATVQDLRYTHDASGNVTRIVDSALRTIVHDNQVVEPAYPYTYDAVYRLIEAGGRELAGQAALEQAPAGGNYRDFPFAGAAGAGDLQAVRGYTERYEYDPVGNLVEIRHVGGWRQGYAYEEPSLLDPAVHSNRLSRTTLQADAGAPAVAPYGYDPHGNTTHMPHLPLMAWDFRDRLRATSRQVAGQGPPAETTFYGYGKGGERARKVTERQNGTRRSERIYLRGVEIYREYGADGVALSLERETLHVSDDGGPIALVETQTVDGGAPVAAPAPVARYQIADGLGSARLELASNAALITFEEHTPYGSSAVQAGRSAAELSLKRYRHTGRERDEESGLTYHSARYCAPWLGRWTSCDPAGLVDGTNLYEYARSNPTRIVDPTGRQGEDTKKVPTPVPSDSVDGQKQPGGDGNPDSRAPPGGKPDEQPAGDQAAGAKQAGPAADRDAAQPGPQDKNWKTGLGAEPGTELDPSKAYKRETARDPESPDYKAQTKNWGEKLKEAQDEKPGIPWTSWLAFFAFVIPAVAAVVWFADMEVPAWVWGLRIGVTAVSLLGLGYFGYKDFVAMKSTAIKAGNSDNLDKVAFDRWSLVHTAAGLVMGAWGVPFPLVAFLTVAWEGFEWLVPGFGESEIPENRASDIAVAWFGWALTGGIIYVGTQGRNGLNILPAEGSTRNKVLHRR